MAGPRAMSPAQLQAAASKLARDPVWAKDLKKANRRVGTFAAREARKAMRASGDRRLARAARAVSSNPEPRSVALRVTSRESGGQRAGIGLSTVWGMKRRTGFNEFVYEGRGNPVRVRAYLGGRRQHPAWVGNDWTVATRGQGPRGVNDALADNVDEIGELYLDMTMDVIVRAMPAGTVR